ncbi:hypothetical protein HPB52_000670 [Rhipicephalus sanguineus]|uniref:Uncharacterized protein n=1 Tax=Rhipicephalus sanguineus TaxID=34632 RepID=A0A9D4Q3K2_RHISA|nr:hypothetical protein HPB52_000670 [Rhipicephalus sanguineus]
MPPEKDKISSAIRGAICVDPVPRNIHPVHNEGRRKARAEAILGKIDSCSTALFVDAAKYWKKDASFSSGFVSAAAASIFNKTTSEANEGEDPLTHIIWFLAHMGNISSSPTGNLNERAHQPARELATAAVTGHL